MVQLDSVVFDSSIHCGLSIWLQSKRCVPEKIVAECGSGNLMTEVLPTSALLRTPRIICLPKTLECEPAEVQALDRKLLDLVFRRMGWRNLIADSDSPSCCRSN